MLGPRLCWTGDGFRKLRPRLLRLHGTVARELGIRIVTGALPPGEMLDGEIAASGQFKVSRTAYREAIRILAAKGLSIRGPKIGTQVSARSGRQCIATHVPAIS